MERTNNNYYNRGGLNNSVNRGGRNYGSHAKGGNNMQGFTNEYQEQYKDNYGTGGRGRGRYGRGIGRGFGRGLPSYRTQTNPTVPYGDQVTDQVINSRSRVASRQPVGSPAVANTKTLTPNRSDRQVQEVPNLEARFARADIFRSPSPPFSRPGWPASGRSVSVTERSKNDVAKAYLPPKKRPDIGTLGVKRFPLKFDHPSDSILRYDVDEDTQEFEQDWVLI